jgi:hypothetical protein
MNDILIATVEDLDQTVSVLAGDNYVALEVDYSVSDAEESRQPDAVVLLAPTGALRLAYSLCKAFLKARKVLAFKTSGAMRGASQ